MAYWPCRVIYFSLVGVILSKPTCMAKIANVSQRVWTSVNEWSVHFTDGHSKNLQLWRPVKKKWSDMMNCVLIYCGGYH